MENAPDNKNDVVTCPDKRWEVVYNISLGARYHMARQQFFGKWHKVTSALSLAFSTSAVATLMSNTKVGMVCAAIVAVLQALDLVIETRKNSELHNELRREYLSLETELYHHPEGLTDAEYSNFQTRIKAIELKEPPIMRTVLLLSKNDVHSVFGLEGKAEISWWKRQFANIINFS